MAQIIADVMTQAGSTLYLLVVSAAIFVCCMAILTATIRLAFGMARDDQLPFSKPMAKVSPRLHTPIVTCIIVGALSAGRRNACVYHGRGLFSRFRNRRRSSGTGHGCRLGRNRTRLGF